MTCKTRLMAAFMAPCLLLSGFTFSPQPRPGRLYFTWHAALTCRDRGTKLSMFWNKLQLYVSDMGSDGGSHADSSVIFRPWMPRDGFYDVTIYYVSGAEDRYFEITVNGDMDDVPCPAGSWDAVSSVTVLLPLCRGFNRIRFGNAAWFAPGLYKIKITESENAEPPPANLKERNMEEFTQNGITLALDKANGTYDVTQNGRLLLSNAFAAAEFEKQRLYTQGYDSHAVTHDGEDVIFAHTKSGLPDLVQRFQFKENYLLTSVAMESPAGVSTNWISPLCTADKNSLGGGAQFLQVPFDNDDYASFKRVGVNFVNRSHEMTALLGSAGDAAVIGSVTHGTWKTGLEWRALGGKVWRFCAYGGMADKQTRDTQAHGAVSGQSVVSPTIFVGAFDDWRDGLDAYGKANADFAPPLPWDGGPILGWSSWGVVQDRLTDEIAFAASDYYKEHFQDWVQEDGDVLYINLDAWWNEAFGRTVEGLRRFVEHCEANGQKAGIYHTPFACWEWQYDDAMKDMVLHDEKGRLLPLWDKAYPFDVTHPKVTAMIEEDIQRFLDAGFSYIKLDFLSHGAMEGVRYDKSVHTGIQAYNQAMARIIQQIDGRMFINLSIAPIFPHQYAHGRRIACDTFYSIDNTKYMLNSLTFGFWQRQIYACPDPDHIVVWGKDGQAGENEARARVTSGIVMNSFLAGDDFANVSAEAQTRFDLLLKNPDIMALARKGITFMPAGLPAAEAANVYVLQDGGVKYYAVFNFGAKPNAFTLEANGPVKELWSGETGQANGSYTVTVNGHDARVYVVDF